MRAKPWEVPEGVGCTNSSRARIPPICRDDRISEPHALGVVLVYRLRRPIRSTKREITAAPQAARATVPY
jgi:hypothetical protein